jgi:transposase
MCLKPQSPRPVPDATMALVHDLFPEGSVYQFVGDVLFDQFRDEDFADLYPKDGQPSISPVLLSFVTIFKSLEDLSDRKTVYGLRFRFDWKYALHLPPEYKGFDHTVLSEFRQRLLTHDGRYLDRYRFQAILSIQDDVKLAHVSCIFGEDVLTIEPKLSSSPCGRRPGGRIVGSAYQ